MERDSHVIVKQKRPSSLVGGKVLDLAAVYRDTVIGLEKKQSPSAEESPQPPQVFDFDEKLHEKYLTVPADSRQNRGADDGEGAGDDNAQMLSCRIEVTNHDCINAAMLLLASLSSSSSSSSSPIRVMVLNFASPNIPGGAVASGVNAQEECIFRRTSIHQHLDPRHVPKAYPINRLRCVVTSAVSIIKDDHYKWLPQPWPVCDIVTCAAEQKPPTTANGLDYCDPSVMTCKVACVLQAAIASGARHLVLGAWGCGGFRNPPHGLASIFKRLLLEPSTSCYGTYFDYVEFAIPGEKHNVAFHKVFDR